MVLALAMGIQCTAQSDRGCVEGFYLSQIGVREATGRNDGREVESYLATTELGKGYPWCAAFVNAGLGHCGVQGPKSAAWSPSWFPASKVIYLRGRAEDRRPRMGDVFGIYFPNRKRIAHVGFVERWGDRKVTTVEGNTNGTGSRDGDGVYRKWRLRSQIYKVADWIGNR